MKQWGYCSEIKVTRHVIDGNERQIYDKIKDLFKISVDYNSKDEITKKFFAKIQNKFIYAIT